MKRVLSFSGLGMGVGLATWMVLSWSCVAATRPAIAPFETANWQVPVSKLDRLVLRDLQRVGLEPSPCCSDAVFVRRVFLDTLGMLPTEAEAREFIADSNPTKRRQLVDHLLARPEYGDFWAMRWGDALRVKAEFPVNLWPMAAQAYHRWILASVRENMPYDRFARTLLTASGSNFRDGAVNFWRATQGRTPEALAQIVALTFMGQRCESWPADRRRDLAVFFSTVRYKSTLEWKEEIVLHDPGPNWALTNALLHLPDGKALKPSSGTDPRQAFADWLLSDKNPVLARAIANRMWAWVMGRGIVHEPDDMRPDNPPVNPELLSYLEKEMILHRYDLKEFLKLVLNSRTYQQSSLDPALPKTNTLAVAHFAIYGPRRLEAEVLVDAINQVTDSGEAYASAIPEPYTVLPEGTRALTLPDGSISSPTLELFGRSSRDTGLLSERNNHPTGAQRLYLLNGSQLRRKIARCGALNNPIKPSAAGRDAVESCYLRILSRPPTEQEFAAISSRAGPREPEQRQLAVDVAWALMNTAEFSHRH